MALSIGTVMTPFMGRGEPMVVITGSFVLGVVSTPYDSGDYGLAQRLMMVGLFSCVDSNHPYVVEVSGRPAALGTYVSPSFPALVTGNTANVNSAWGRGDTNVYNNNGGSDMPLSVRMVEAYDDVRWNQLSGDIGTATRSGFRVGQLVSSSVRIVIRGKLNNLDLKQLKAGTVSADTHESLFTDLVSGTSTYNFPGYGAGTGWRAYGVHVIDQPQLRGHVSNVPAHCKVVWD